MTKVNMLSEHSGWPFTNHFETMGVPNMFLIRHRIKLQRFVSGEVLHFPWNCVDLKCYQIDFLFTFKEKSST